MSASAKETSEAQAAATNALDHLADAFRAALPRANLELWAQSMQAHLNASKIITPRRLAAFLGQVSVEAGADLAGLAEDLHYTHAERLCAVFPTSFPTITSAQPYVDNPEAIACRVYAEKLGNSDAASGDGWRFRGSGLLQLTGRATFSAFASVLSAPAEHVADWVRTPNGAVASACWYWRWHNLNNQADAWNLAAITLAVNGHAMLAHMQRVAASEAALRAIPTA